MNTENDVDPTACRILLMFAQSTNPDALDNFRDWARQNIATILEAVLLFSDVARRNPHLLEELDLLAEEFVAMWRDRN